MLDPELVSVFVREFHQEYGRRSADRTRRRSKVEKRRDEAEMHEIDALPVIALHPGIAEDYRRQVRELARALTADEEARLQTSPIVRGLIDRVALTPNSGLRGVNIEVFGRLASLLQLATGEAQPTAMYAVSGAGEGNRTLVFSLGSCCSTIELHPQTAWTRPVQD